MKTTKNIARLAVTAGLTAALSFGGVMAPVTMAFAAEGGTAASYVPTATTTGNVTIAENTYAGTSFKGIQIFRATVTQGKADTNGDGVADANGAWNKDGEKTLSDIQWATPEVEKAVKGVFAHDTNPGDSATAQDWADYINRIVAGNAGEGFKVDADSALDKIAKELEKVNTTDEATGWKASTDGKFSTLSAGYWLFVTAGVSGTANTTKGNTDAYTSPIFAIVGGADVNAEPKKGVPIVKKEILDDADADADGVNIKTSNKWKDIADSQIGQEVNYRLTGSVASNYATYDSYAYRFTDELSSGLDFVNGSVEVYALNDSNYTLIDGSNYHVTKPDASNDNTLKVEFKVDGTDKGLKDVAGINDKTQIVVFYRAKLNGNAVIGNAKDEFGKPKKGGNPNTVTLEYSNNPHAQGTGKTIEHTVADFAFRLNLKKVDQGTEKGLEGAVFTIQSADVNTMGKYVASRAGEFGGSNVVAGQLVDVPSDTSVENLPDCVKFTSDNNGMITSSGLDAGSYKVTEIKAPGSNNEYTAAGHFTFTITPKYSTDGTMNVKTIDASLDPSRSDVVLGELDETAGDNKLNVKDGSATNPADGVINITVGNTKQIKLPLTGLNGVTFTWIAGGAVLCIGVAHLIRSRKSDDGSEE